MTKAEYQQLMIKLTNDNVNLVQDMLDRVNGRARHIVTLSPRRFTIWRRPLRLNSTTSASLKRDALAPHTRRQAAARCQALINIPQRQHLLGLSAARPVGIWRIVALLKSGPAHRPANG